MIEGKCFKCGKIEEWPKEPHMVSITYCCEDCAKNMNGYVQVLVEPRYHARVMENMVGSGWPFSPLLPDQEDLPI